MYPYSQSASIQIYNHYFASLNFMIILAGRDDGVLGIFFTKYKKKFLKKRFFGSLYPVYKYIRMYSYK